jgi:hypothetical protein
MEQLAVSVQKDSIPLYIPVTASVQESGDMA